MENTILHVYYYCKPGMAQEMVRAIKEGGLQAKVQAEDGCIQYDYAISCEQADTVVLLERWRDGAAVDKHLTQPHMTDIRAVIAEYTTDKKIERYE